MRRTLLIAVLAPVFVACAGPMEAIKLSARLECSDNWGRTIPKESRTPDNCWEKSHRVLAEQGRDVGAGSGSDTYTGSTGTHTYILPSGTYQVSRAGSTTFVTQTSRSRR